MREKTNIIEINGKRYDAVTGERLTPASAAHHHVSHDSADKAAPKLSHKPSLPSKPAVKHAARQPARHAGAHTPAPSHTLMRQAVKKPAPSSKHRITAQGHTDSLSKKPAELTLSRSIGQIDEKRLRHAKAVPKSRLISRFPQITVGSFQPTPLQPPEARFTPEAFRSGKPARQADANSTDKRPRTTSELLENALQRATSHQEKPVKPVRHGRAKRNLAIGGTAALALVVFGIIFTQNLPNVRLQMASAKVGFDASLPGYRPSGYSLGQLSYSGSAVAAHFNSNSDSRRYTITQERSSWNDAMLLNNFVAPTDSNYQIERANDLTIYLYGNRNATWLKDGVWYVIQSNDSLSDRQLTELAVSL